METNLSSKCCRICSIETEFGISLFGEEALKLFLQDKIKKYLSLTVLEEDKLPKMICLDCCRRIDGFHRFATMALKNQEKMSKFLDTCTNNNNNEDEEKAKIEYKSLLHSYLTKETKENSSQEVTEVEVRVDPMMILQCELIEEDDSEAESETKPNQLHSPSNSDELVMDLSEVENSNQYHKPYQCTMCVRSFTSEFALQSHSWGHISRRKKILNVHHSSSENDTDENVTEHNNDSEKCQERDGVRNEDLSCPVCGRIASTEGNLKIHIETHRPKGKFGCDICGRIFKTSCNLHRHKEYHDGIQYPCNICGRVYPTNSTLRAHSITHSDLRPHKCPLCDKTFKRNQDLKFHINQHTGARPYQCPYCPKAFASSGNCFSHRKRMHPIEVERDRERAARIMR